MSKGQYYKIRTRNWFKKQGYQTELLEKAQRILTKTGKIVWIKKDVFGADGLAMNKEEMIFWNAKFGKKNIAQGLKEMEKFTWPEYIKRWVIAWEFRAREPIIAEVNATSKKHET